MDGSSFSGRFSGGSGLPPEGVLETPRLVLRQARTDDVDVYTRLWTDPEVRRFLGGPVDEGRLRLRQQRFAGRPRVFSVTRGRDGSVIGTVALERAGRHGGRWEMSYSFLTECWGRGYGKEAVGAVVGWVLDAAPAPDASLIAVTQEANVRSRRLLDTVGLCVRERFVESGAPQVLYGAGCTGLAAGPG
ncbi:GNAT family N-acetyltransferase [Streptomyces sp. NPDC047002]|uniref:GNAT family N-acetyltransferase n=1 Tax=Streptomyces sp. NPDC047002 TaxID=3155475 RepID=UPI00345725D5